MCWSEQVSWLSFIIGSAINMWVASRDWGVQRSKILALCLLWQWVLFVQVAEAYIWRGNTTSNDNLVRVASMSQYLLILTQPIILGLAFLAIGAPEAPYENKILAGSLLGAYVVWCLYSVWKVPDMSLTRPGCAEKHLEMTWWNKIPGGAIPYLVAIAAVVMLLIRPMNVMWWCLAFVFGTLLASSLFYSCGTGSMWCWFAVSAPLVTWLIFKTVASS